MSAPTGTRANLAGCAAAICSLTIVAAPAHAFEEEYTFGSESDFTMTIRTATVRQGIDGSYLGNVVTKSEKSREINDFEMRVTCKPDGGTYWMREMESGFTGRPQFWKRDGSKLIDAVASSMCSIGFTNEILEKAKQRHGSTG